MELQRSISFFFFSRLSYSSACDSSGFLAVKKTLSSSCKRQDRLWCHSRFSRQTTYGTMDINTFIHWSCIKLAADDLRRILSSVKEPNGTFSLNIKGFFFFFLVTIFNLDERLPSFCQATGGKPERGKLRGAAMHTWWHVHALPPSYDGSQVGGWQGERVVWHDGFSVSVRASVKTV